MADAGSVAGAYSILVAFRQILRDHLQEWLDAIAAEQGITALTAPDATRGYAIGRIAPRDYSPSIRLHRARSTYKTDETHNRGAPRRKFTLIEARVRYGAPVIDQTDEGLMIYLRAIEGAISEYHRAYHGDTKAGTVEATIIEDIDSIFEQDRIEGYTTRGRAAETTDSEATIVFDVVQSVYHPISKDK